MRVARVLALVGPLVIAGCGGKAKTGGLGEQGTGAAGGSVATQATGGTSSGKSGIGGGPEVAGAPADMGASGETYAASYPEGSDPVTYAPPAAGQVWTFELENPFNLAPPVIVAVDDDVIVAATSKRPPSTGSDPSEPQRPPGFVTRLTNGQAAWKVTLSTTGQPAAIARSGDAVIVVASPQNGAGVTLAKIGVDGTLRYETPLPLAHEQSFANGLAVADSGAIFLAGGYTDDTGEHVLFVKCDSDGNVLWEKTFVHSGAYAQANAMAVLAGGDVVATGEFDATLAFGGATDTLASSVPASAQPGTTSGFVVRLTPGGDALWSSTFGGQGQADGIALAAVADDYFLVGGEAAPDVSFRFGGRAPPSASSPTPGAASTSIVALVALLDGQGKPAWVNLEPEAYVAYSVAADNAGTVLLGGMMDTSGLDSTYLRTYDIATGQAAGTLTTTSGSVTTGSIAVAPNGSVWLSGCYGRQADLGNENVLASQSGSEAFVIRVEPE
jgi:hypothetical protein